MKNSLQSLFLLVFQLLLFQSCMNTITGEGPVVEKERNVDTFNKVVLNMDAEMLVTNAGSQGVKIAAQENILDAIVTRVEGKTLVITCKGIVVNSKPVVIKIDVSQPEAFELNGSGEMSSTNMLENEMIDFEVNGSGKMQMNARAHRVSGAVTGSGQLNLSGISDDFNMQINGSGTVDAGSLRAITSTVKINGSGDVLIDVEHELNATINGSGNVKYHGNPRVNKTIRGSGSVEGSTGNE